MDNLAQTAVLCKVCNRKREYLDSEKIILSVHREGDSINTARKMTALNLHMYCGNCKTNNSEPFTYENEKFIEPFIKDVQKHSVKFNKAEYLDVVI